MWILAACGSGHYWECRTEAYGDECQSVDYDFQKNTEIRKEHHFNGLCIATHFGQKGVM